jgi:hypothetical protein
MPKLIRILLVIVKVNECGTSWVQKMLFQEGIHQVAGINTLNLKAICHFLKKKLAKQAIFK